MREETYQAITILKSLRHKRGRIEDIRIRIVECRERATRGSSSLSETYVKGSVSSRIENAIITIDDLERQLRETEECLNLERYRIQEAINRIQGDEQRRLLELRYIDGKTWKCVQRTMHISKTTSYRLHCDALEQFYRIYKSPASRHLMP